MDVKKELDTLEAGSRSFLWVLSVAHEAKMARLPSDKVSGSSGDLLHPLGPYSKRTKPPGRASAVDLDFRSGHTAVL